MNLLQSVPLINDKLPKQLHTLLLLYISLDNIYPKMTNILRIYVIFGYIPLNKSLAWISFSS